MQEKSKFKIPKTQQNKGSKDYDRLFKDLYKENRVEGSAYPNLYNPEAIFIHGAWLIMNKN